MTARRKLFPLLLLFITAAFLFAFTSPCNNIPPLNKEVHKFVKESLNKKVGRGECWDLAAQALNSAGADWDGQFNFGKPVDPATECIYPGDVIQYKNVRVQYREGNTFYEEEMDQHTSVVFEVKTKGSFVVAEQNTTKHGRRAGLSDFNLDNIKKGKVQFFRPRKK